MKKSLAVWAAVLALASPLTLSTRSSASEADNPNSMPKGDLPGWHQLFAENFNGDSIPQGKFADCNHYVNTTQAYCAKLPEPYRSDWWAYPRGWYDTANPKNVGNDDGDRTFGGEYRADDTTSVGPGATGDGQLHVRIYRPTSGDNHVAALVPKRCMDLHYGRFAERMIVRDRTDGFKLANLHYGDDDSEIDYPEAGGNFADDPISWFTHGFDENGGDVAPGSAWTSWHTYTQDVTPSGVTFYLDGKKVGHTSADYPATTPRVLQMESSLSGGYADVGASAKIDYTWVTCYKYDPKTVAK